jgi:hopanoid C-3 methylase
VARQLAHGQANFAKMIWKFNHVYHPDRQYAEHQRQPRYLLPPPAEPAATPPDLKDLYIHVPERRRSAT